MMQKYPPTLGCKAVGHLTLSVPDELNTTSSRQKSKNSQEPNRIFFICCKIPGASPTGFSGWKWADISDNVLDFLRSLFLPIRLRNALFESLVAVRDCCWWVSTASDESPGSGRGSLYIGPAVQIARMGVSQVK